jgi:hypothetical protein
VFTRSLLRLCKEAGNSCESCALWATGPRSLSSLSPHPILRTTLQGREQDRWSPAPVSQSCMGMQKGLHTCKAGTLVLQPHLWSILLWLFWRLGLMNYLPRLASNLKSPLISAFRVTRIPGVSHQRPARLSFDERSCRFKLQRLDMRKENWGVL